MHAAHNLGPDPKPLVVEEAIRTTYRDVYSEWATATPNQSSRHDYIGTVLRSSEAKRTAKRASPGAMPRLVILGRRQMRLRLGEVPEEVLPGTEQVYGTWEVYLANEGPGPVTELRLMFPNPPLEDWVFQRIPRLNAGGTVEIEWGGSALPTQRDLRDSTGSRPEVPSLLLKVEFVREGCDDPLVVEFWLEIGPEPHQEWVSWATRGGTDWSPLR